ncbi:hypothetical protein HRI_003794300 [Hibiscus trionum]|uniref:Uncharacterized protein n=1 Tax=Hibiscus trionum TaxID=183268 RepID=A0A9W7IS18_HIBTR|nr:hypothetical protein HRI_003794300 [Hibiscus trionum]
MAVELRPAEAIPRVSFSHYLFSPMQQYHYCPPLRSIPVSPDSSTEFTFYVRVNNRDDDQECECCYLSANELFANGKILPLQIKKQPVLPPQEPQPQLDGTNARSKNQSWSGNKRRLCPSTPKVKPEGHRNRKGNHRQDKKSSFKHGSHRHGHGAVTTISPLLNVPVVDVFCLSSIFSSSSRNK